MNSLILFVLMIIIHLIFAANQNPGHLKPFGSVGSLINIKELNQEYPTISELFTYYISKSEPILSRQVLNNDKYFSTWQTDKQLENDIYGLFETTIQVEIFKSRQRQRMQMNFGEFLNRLGKESLFYADNVPEVLQKYLIVPKPLQCDIALDSFQSAILVMNSINTSPLMFAEDYDHFHCILRGNKRIVLVNTIKYPDVRKIVVPDKRQQYGSPVNPDRVDFDQFPALANIDYYVANLTSGDCLFIPNNWIFQERSFENSIVIVYNIKHQQALNTDRNELKTCAEYDPTFTLDQVVWPSENQHRSFKELMASLVHSKIEGFDKWQEVFSKHLSYDLASDPEVSAIFEEFYGIIDLDGDGQVTATEVEQIDGVHQHHITDILYEMARIITNKRKTSTSKPVNIKNEQSEQILENDEQTDEHLHLQNFKTDL